MNYKKLLSLLFLGLFLYQPPCFAADFSIGESVTDDPELLEKETALSGPVIPVFGKNLFKGNFKNIKQPWFNPEYRIQICDVISVRIWGAVEFAGEMPVDSQGNIFLPKMGTCHVLGVKNNRLVSLISDTIRGTYREKVFVYANMANYQPITVFVSGNVNKPGIYMGMASDSTLQFIDKAGGIINAYGSFRNIEILRNNILLKRLDLYGFLTKGRLDPFQFQSGDVISVKDVAHRIDVTGDVKRPCLFEFLKDTIRLDQVLDLAILNPTATNVTITHWTRDNEKNIFIYALDKIDDIFVVGGDSVNVFPDSTVNLNTITIDGEHDGLHTLLVGKDATLQALIDGLKLNPRSNLASMQLFRKSVAKRQKQLLLSKLQELESLILLTPSVTKEESLMRSQETKSVLSFIERAKKVEPKGQIVINKKTRISDIYLEDGDTVYIPSKTNIVLVQGEVSFPGAHTHVANLSAADYIALSGEMNHRADEKKILIIHQDGRVQKCDNKNILKKIKLARGDSLLVLPKLEGKNLQITKDITQILYQVAVSAGVLLAL